MNISQLLLDAWFGDNDSILVLGDFCEENNIYFQGLINADVEESLYLNRYEQYHHYGNGCGYGNGYGDGNGGNGNGDGYSYDTYSGYDYSDGDGYGYDTYSGEQEFYL